MFDPKKLMEMFKNAGEMQKKMTQNMKNQKVTGEAGGGMVRITMNGHFEVESLNIDESLLKEEKSFVEDVVKAAINDAAGQLRNVMMEQVKNISGSFGL